MRFTFLPFVTLTPFGIWFLKAMGMKITREELELFKQGIRGVQQFES